jgi:transposase InsO family protein
MSAVVYSARAAGPAAFIPTSRAAAANVLDRAFEASAPNCKWIADFTYIWTAEGRLYVAAVLDLFSRRVVGWSMSATITAQFVADALMMAIWRRGRPEAMLHHSDRAARAESNGRRNTDCVLSYRRNWSRASAGVRQPRVFRVLALRAMATAARLSTPCRLRSVPFGK